MHEWQGGQGLTYRGYYESSSAKTEFERENSLRPFIVLPKDKFEFFKEEDGRISFQPI